MSRASVYRFLPAGGISLNPPQRTIASPDVDYALKKTTIEDARDHLKVGDVFYYADEFNVSWFPTLRAMWSPVDQQVMIPHTGQPVKHYGLGAVDYHTGETVVITRRRKRRKEEPSSWKRCSRST